MIRKVLLAAVLICSASGLAMASPTPGAGGDTGTSSTGAPATDAPTTGAPATGGAATGGTTASGQTKPAGEPVGDRMGTRPDLEEKSRDLDRKINTGICTGCK